MWYALTAMRYTDGNLVWHSHRSSKFGREMFQTDDDAFTVNNNTCFGLLMHYLDYAFGMHRPHLASKQHELAGETLKKLGLATKEPKDNPQTTIQKMLGVECDAKRLEVRIPTCKINECMKFAHSLCNAWRLQTDDCSREK